MTRTLTRALTTAALMLLGAASSRASDLVSVQPLTDRIVMLHFDDGYVEHHKRGQARSDEKVITDPLDVRKAARADTYRIASADDPAYRAGRAPRGVGRKTKGTDFAWFVDRWEGRAINDRPDFTAEHWLYLELPAPMKPGRTYTIGTGALAKNGSRHTLKFDVTRARSEAVHVNTLGYVPSAPEKFAYVYHWMGDRGPLQLGPSPRHFRIVSTSTGKAVFTGQVKFRKPGDTQETYHKSDSPPHGNFLGADVWECDFSAVRAPGSYVVVVDGVGCSWPFRIGADVYRPAFTTVARGLYHNRSGIALTRPYTNFERPAPQNPNLTPVFKDKLRYTRVRWPEWGSEGGDAKKLMEQSPGTLSDAWGWYQDAGDWDGYYSHLRVAQELLIVFNMAPSKFRDGELNIPESGNGIPDLVDEAAWLPRFCYRLRHELIRKGWGTGGVGLRVAGDAFGSDEGKTADGKAVGRGSWEDDRIYMVSGEDPWSTYRYAGCAAQLALAYRKAGVKADPQQIDWVREAREAFAWAKANTQNGDETPQGGMDLKLPRAYAAAALFVLTGDESYEQQLARDTDSIKEDSLVWEEQGYGPFVYALSDREPEQSKPAHDAALLSRLRAAILRTADESLITTREKRALRWGGNYSFPMLIGHQTTPWALEGAVAHALTKNSEPERARAYLAGLYTTCDYFLGTNALNQTWVTGLGPRYPQHVFHMDAWYNGKGKFHPGIIPYGPWRKDKAEGDGPWDKDWPNKSVYPAIDSWPGNERWFDNRCSPLTGEFTIHQNTGPAAALFGYLCADAPKTPTGSYPTRGR